LIKTGEPLKKMNDQKESEKEYTQQVSSLDWMMSPSSYEMVSLLDIGKLRKNLNILDVGAGSGVWSLPIVSADTTSKTTLLDWEAVLSFAKKKVTEKKLEKRTSYLVGDFFEIELVQKYDLIIVGNIVHTQSREKNLILLKKLKHALAVNGELLVIDVFPENDQWRLSRLLYDIGLKLRTEEGGVYEIDEVCSMLREVGLMNIEVNYMSRVPPHIMGVCIAT
jgi:ubiquinone/menaquinone biosynthesis C-methylase UbiE